MSGRFSGAACVSVIQLRMLRVRVTEWFCVRPMPRRHLPLTTKHTELLLTGILHGLSARKLGPCEHACISARGLTDERLEKSNAPEVRIYKSSSQLRMQEAA